MNHEYIKINIKSDEWKVHSWFCEKCNLIKLQYYNNPPEFYYSSYSQGWINLSHELTCEEMIIKNILE